MIILVALVDVILFSRNFPTLPNGTEVRGRRTARLTPQIKTVLNLAGAVDVRRRS